MHPYNLCINDITVKYALAIIMPLLFSCLNTRDCDKRMLVHILVYLIMRIIFGPILVV